MFGDQNPGMGIFGALSLVIFRLDLLISNSRFVIGALMMFSGPAISGIVTFESSRNAGEPGEFEYLMPFALFLHGSWLLYYLFLFNVKETLEWTDVALGIQGHSVSGRLWPCMLNVDRSDEGETLTRCTTEQNGDSLLRTAAVMPVLLSSVSGKFDGPSTTPSPPL